MASLRHFQHLLEFDYSLLVAVLMLCMFDYTQVPSDIPAKDNQPESEVCCNFPALSVYGIPRFSIFSFPSFQLDMDLKMSINKIYKLTWCLVMIFYKIKTWLIACQHIVYVILSLWGHCYIGCTNNCANY